MPKLQKFMVARARLGTMSYVLNQMGPFAQDSDLCLREFSKYLTDRAYTRYVNLNKGQFMIGSIWCTYPIPSFSMLKLSSLSSS